MNIAKPCVKTWLKFNLINENIFTTEKPGQRCKGTDKTLPFSISSPGSASPKKGNGQNKDIRTV